jgi:hypothetical protein
MKDDAKGLVVHLDTAKKPPRKVLPGGVTYNDFYAYMPQHSYIFVPTRETWPAASVNSRLPKVMVGEKAISASEHLDKTRPVEQMTWAPGEAMLIKDRLLADDGWIERDGVNCFNLYRPPSIKGGDAQQAGPWLDHVRRLYPDEAEHIIRWLAQRVQQPEVKPNHALVLIGSQGTGKDTMIEPVRYAVGPWNCAEVSPQQLLGRFNGFVKSVILRISEARDLGDVNRYAFYEHLKTYTASPPGTLRTDEKHLREYQVLNVVGVVITTNYKTGGIYLPADDRRHFVAYSTLAKEDFAADYFPKLWKWYRNGGNAHVACYLRTLDISDYDPKAAPPQTPAWWDIVDSSRAPEDADLADVLDHLGNPDAVTLTDIILHTQDGGFREWLVDRRNRRLLPHRFEQAGYVAVRNPYAKDGLWKIRGKRQVVYAKASLSITDQVKAGQELL